MSLYTQFIKDTHNRDYYVPLLLSQSEELQYLYHKYANKDYPSFPIVIQESDEIYIKEDWYIEFLCIVSKRDSLVVERNGFIRGVRFVKEEFLDNVGDWITRNGNSYGTLGDGLYCYLPNNPNAHRLWNNHCALILEGEVNYWECLFYNDEDKVGEILILPNTPIQIIDICHTQEELNNWIVI